VLPLSPGRLERHGFEYRRNGTLSLYAALDVKTGKVQGKTAERHTSTEFVGFLEQVVSGCKPGKRSRLRWNHAMGVYTKAPKPRPRAAPNWVTSNVTAHAMEWVR
jgi:hypothetical protein